MLRFEVYFVFNRYNCKYCVHYPTNKTFIKLAFHLICCCSLVNEYLYADVQKPKLRSSSVP